MKNYVSRVAETQFIYRRNDGAVRDKKRRNSFLLFCGLEKMKRCKLVSGMLLVTIVTMSFIGCSYENLDPKQIGRFQPVPVVNVILDSLGVAEEADATYSSAEDPTPADVISYEQDYVFGIGDIIGVSIYELRRERTPYIENFRVTETGRISIPDVGQVRAVGLTERKLEDEIKDILSPSILKDPAISVQLLESEQRVYSIAGWGITRDGRYPVPRYSYRLSDAIATAGDVNQFNVTNIYITRVVPIEDQVDRQLMISPDGDGGTVPELKSVEPGTEDDIDIMDLIRPYTDDEVMISSAELGAGEELLDLAAPEGVAASKEKSQRVEWVLENGKWVPKKVDGSDVSDSVEGGVAKPMPVLAGQNKATSSLAKAPAKAMRTRVIRIPVDKLKSGDPRYDIIIRPGDSISVPGDVVGEFYVMGNVNRTGPVTLTGRPMTLKMAIASAGGLNEMAWPKKVEVVRRLGRNKSGLVQEETVLVDLDKIAKGLQPDFFIKPHDLINVGTHGISNFLYQLRNAFRPNYGFGLYYDRNFAAQDFGNNAFPGHFGL